MNLNLNIEVTRQLFGVFKPPEKASKILDIKISRKKNVVCGAFCASHCSSQKYSEILLDRAACK